MLLRAYLLPLSAVLLLGMQPSFCFADVEEEVEAYMDHVADETAQDAEDHSAHGTIQLSDIFNGEHSIEFWGAVVNFVLLLLVLRKLAKQPLSNFLASRRNEVEAGMKEAAALKAKAEAVYAEYSERLKTMDEDMEKLRTDIQAAAQADKERILADAEETSARLRKDTDALIAQHGRELVAAVRTEVVEAAVAAAEEVLRTALSADDQRRLATQFRNELAHTGERT